MFFKRVFPFALYIFPALLISSAARNLYLDWCGPVTYWEADLFGSCSKAIGILIQFAVVLSPMMVLRYVAPSAFEFYFGKRRLTGSLKQNGAGSVDPAPPRAP
ncbi:MAG: hypothetical protein FJX60_05645 [Alphaproteobacteria bacterium]|nr:hypothetical protein [Alphaproteobacteria bacterium]